MDATAGSWIVHNIEQFPDFYINSFERQRVHLPGFILCFSIAPDQLVKVVDAIEYEDPIIYFYELPRLPRMDVWNSDTFWHVLYGILPQTTPFLATKAVQTIGNLSVLVFSKLGSANMDIYSKYITYESESSLITYQAQYEYYDEVHPIVCNSTYSVRNLYGQLKLPREYVGGKGTWTISSDDNNTLWCFSSASRGRQRTLKVSESVVCLNHSGIYTRFAEIGISPNAPFLEQCVVGDSS
ncbi:hypothetical protein D918_02513 [Trichuris suis]|nr:hypothetical protein D918_02513 [Trichuris suis]